MEDNSALSAQEGQVVLSYPALATILGLMAAALVGIGLLAGRMLLAPRQVSLPSPAPTNAAAQAAEPRQVSADERRGIHTRPWSCKPGPWGNMEFVPIQIEPPMRFMPPDWDRTSQTKWFFEKTEEAQVAELFRSAGLPADQAAVLLDRKYWTVAADGVTVAPPSDTVLQMPKDARIKIYGVLARYGENSAQQMPYVFRPELLEERFAQSQLQPKNLALLQDVLYPRGGRLLFSDMLPVLNAIDDHPQRLALIKSVCRVRTLLAKVKIGPGMDVREVADYWDGGGRAKDVRPLLESLTRLPEGGTLDIVHLIPPFARRRLYTYADPTVKTEVEMDCHWTTFNFFNETPLPQFADIAYVSAHIAKEYDRITSDMRLGDVVLYTRPDGDVVHSAVYVADDVIFTRNGFAALVPWIFSTIGEVHEVYEAKQPDSAPLSISYWRRRM